MCLSLWLCFLCRRELVFYIHALTIFVSVSIFNVTLHIYFVLHLLIGTTDNLDSTGHGATTEDPDNTGRLTIALCVLAPVAVLVCLIIMAVAIFKAIHDMKSGKLTLKTITAKFNGYIISGVWLSQLHASLGACIIT